MTPHQKALELKVHADHRLRALPACNEKTTALEHVGDLVVVAVYESRDASHEFKRIVTLERDTAASLLKVRSSLLVPTKRDYEAPDYNKGDRFHLAEDNAMSIETRQPVFVASATPVRPVFGPPSPVTPVFGPIHPGPVKSGR